MLRAVIVPFYPECLAAVPVRAQALELVPVRLSQIVQVRAGAAAAFARAVAAISRTGPVSGSSSIVCSRLPSTHAFYRDVPPVACSSLGKSRAAASLALRATL